MLLKVSASGLKSTSFGFFSYLLSLSNKTALFSNFLTSYESKHNEKSKRQFYLKSDCGYPASSISVSVSRIHRVIMPSNTTLISGKLTVNASSN